MIKLRLMQIGIVVLSVILALAITFMLFASCNTFEAKEIDYTNYINRTFATQNTDTTLKFVGNEKLEISNERKRTIYVIVEETKGAVKVSDSQQDFYIKFVDENTIFCEKTQQYMYLSEHKERLLWLQKKNQ